MTMKIQPAPQALANLCERKRQDTDGRHESLRGVFRELQRLCDAIGIHTAPGGDINTIALQLIDFGSTLKLDRLMNITLDQNGQQKAFPTRDLLDYDAASRSFTGKEYSDVVPRPGERPQKQAAVDVVASWIANEIIPN
jgi:hypothetical protein